MLIKEYRIVLPLTVDQYRRAQLYTVATASRQETGGGEGVQVLENRPFVDGDVTGQYTHKVYHVDSRLPPVVRLIAPKRLTSLRELAWNSYPNCRTVLTNEYLGDKFEICVESRHLADAGTTSGALGASGSRAEVVHIDVVNDGEAPDDGLSGRYGREWIAELKEGGGDVMCAYKLVTCKFNYWGLQDKVEQLIHEQERKLFTMFHRQLLEGRDQWLDMSIGDVRAYEEKTQKELARRITQGDVTGSFV